MLLSEHFSRGLNRRSTYSLGGVGGVEGGVGGGGGEKSSSGVGGRAEKSYHG